MIARNRHASASPYLLAAHLSLLAAPLISACGGAGAGPTPPVLTTTIPQADPCARATGPEPTPFFVYADSGDRRNHFIPSGFFGDVDDLAIDVAHASLPQTGTTSIRIDYRPRGTQTFAGIFWQCPEGNFGQVSSVGFNLTRARQVRFYARSNTPGARVEFKVGGLGRGTEPMPFPDSLPSTPTTPVIANLDTGWREFTIHLASQNLTYIIGGFAFVVSATENPSGVTVFLDNIAWE